MELAQSPGELLTTRPLLVSCHQLAEKQHAAPKSRAPVVRRYQRPRLVRHSPANRTDGKRRCERHRQRAASAIGFSTDAFPSALTGGTGTFSVIGRETRRDMMARGRDPPRPERANIAH